MKWPAVLASFAPLLLARNALAEEPRIHLATGAAHAAFGAQSSEFGAGGVGSGSVELPATARIGLQASAGALVLSKGDSARDAGVASTSTGLAFFGTLGLRLRAFGAGRVAGPWVDSDFGVARTGDLIRPAFDAHLGWDFRVPGTSRVDVGPFVGYTQIFQPSGELRSSDAHILTAGLSFSLGAKERPAALAPKGVEPPPPPAPPPPVDEAREEVAEAIDVCKDGEPPTEDGCGDGVRLFEDRILLDDVVHFEFDSSRIRSQSHPLVHNIARFIGAHADITDISIEGHADEVGSAEYNEKLSRERAESMKALLVRFGVEASRLRVVGYGSSKPKIATQRPDVRNRRVELFVTRTHQQVSTLEGNAR